MNKTKFISFLLGSLFGGACFYLFVFSLNYYRLHSHYDGIMPGTQEYEDYKKAHPSPPVDVGQQGSIAPIYPADISNNSILLGASHNVFIGKVLSQSGNKETGIGPRTQYQMQVIDNIKGNLKGVVTIDMLGGYDKNGNISFVEDSAKTLDDIFLKPGSTYVLATRYNKDENWYTVIAHPNAKKILSDDKNLSDEYLILISHDDIKFRQLEQAYPNEIPDSTDEISGNTRNAYKSLPAEEKAAADTRASEAETSLAGKMTNEQ